MLKAEQINEDTEREELLFCDNCKCYEVHLINPSGWIGCCNVCGNERQFKDVKSLREEVKKTTEMLEKNIKESLEFSNAEGLDEKDLPDDETDKDGFENPSIIDGDDKPDEEPSPYGDDE